MTGTGEASYVGRLAILRRYPVKSLVGEALEQARIDERGVEGDRAWSVRDPDGKLGSGKSTRRFRRMNGLLALTAHYDADTPVVGFPDGRTVRGDDPKIHAALSANVGRPVRLAPEEDVPHFDDGRSTWSPPRPCGAWSSGRADRSAISASTLSVIRLTVSFDTEAP